MRKQKTIIERSSSNDKESVAGFSRAMSIRPDPDKPMGLTDEEHDKLFKKKQQLKGDIDNMQKQILMLNNEIKSKKHLLEELTKKTGGKKPTATGGDFNHKAAAEFVAMKDEIMVKDQKIEKLLNRINVLEHEYEKVKSFKDAARKLRELEAEMEERERLNEEQAAKMKKQEDAIKEWQKACEVQRKENEDMRKLLEAKEDECDEQTNKLKQIEGQMDFFLNEQQKNKHKSQDIMMDLKAKERELDEANNTIKTQKNIIRELEEKLKHAESSGTDAVN